jgi:AraC-like DNA-binding protein
VRHSLIRGATLILHGDNEVDLANFRRWSDYLCSETATKRNLAVDEILLRFERMQFEPFTLIEPRYGFPGLTTREESEAPGNAWRICSHIADNFRSDIDSGSISKSISLHPKYAMNVFKKNTGMTINEYINLLRLSYAQAMLIDNDSDISRISIESGFHSLSAFNGAFRKACGLSPTDFRRGAR